MADTVHLKRGRTPAVLLLGSTGSGKTPLGDLIERRGLRGVRCLHFDFGVNLRKIVDRDSIGNKLAIFNQRTAPLLDYYAAQAARIETIEVTAGMTPQDVWRSLSGRQGAWNLSVGEELVTRRS